MRKHAFPTNHAELMHVDVDEFMVINCTANTLVWVYGVQCFWIMVENTANTSWGICVRVHMAYGIRNINESGRINNVLAVNLHRS